MNTSEDQVRNAYRRAAETVRPESLRPSVLDPARPVPSATRGRLAIPGFRGRLRVLAPVAAAVAVVTVAAVAVAVPRMLGTAVRPEVPASGPSLAGPPFLAVIRLSGVLDIESAQTGRFLAEVRSPRAGTMWGDAAATGRTQFLLTAVPSHLYTCANTLLYTLTLNGSGRVASLRPFTVPEVPGTLGDGYGEGNLTVSADGSTVALLTANCGKHGPSDADHFSPNNDIMVIRGGEQRTWNLPQQYTGSGLSLSADGSKLGYVESYIKVPVPTLGAARVLPTDAASGPADAHSYLVLTDSRGWRQCCGLMATAEVLSADGGTMYVFTRTGKASPSAPVQWTGSMSVYDVATHVRLRTMHTWNHLGGIPAAITAVGNQALMWGMYGSSPVVTQLNLATGAVSDRQLPVSSQDLIRDVAW
jgi:hypothetical protein